MSLLDLQGMEIEVPMAAGPRSTVSYACPPSDLSVFICRPTSIMSLITC